MFLCRQAWVETLGWNDSFLLFPTCLPITASFHSFLSLSLCLLPLLWHAFSFSQHFWRRRKGQKEEKHGDARLLRFQGRQEGSRQTGCTAWHTSWPCTSPAAARPTQHHLRTCPRLRAPPMYFVSFTPLHAPLWPLTFPGRRTRTEEQDKDDGRKTLLWHMC